MRLSLSRRARVAASLAALLLAAALAAPTAAMASPPDHSNAGGNGGNNGVACDDPPAGGGNPGQGNAGQGNDGGVGNVCDDDRAPVETGDGSSTVDPDGSGANQDTDDPDTNDPDTNDPDTDDPGVGGDLCDDLLVTLSPTATDGDGHAVAITSQTLEAGVPGWAAASWQAASGTTLTAVFARTAAGDVSLPPSASGHAVGVESLTFCGTTSGVIDDGAPEEPEGSEPGRGTGGGDKPDTPARPTPSPDTTPGAAAPHATATAATPASTAPAPAPATTAATIQPSADSTEDTDNTDQTEDAEVLGIQLAAVDTPETEFAETDAPSAVADILPIADEREGAAGLVVGGGLALATLIGLLLIAWRRRKENDTQEVTA